MSSFQQRIPGGYGGLAILYIQFVQDFLLRPIESRLDHVSYHFFLFVGELHTEAGQEVSPVIGSFSALPNVLALVPGLYQGGGHIQTASVAPEICLCDVGERQ